MKIRMATIIILSLFLLTSLCAGGQTESTDQDRFVYDFQDFTGIEGSAAYKIEVKRADSFSVVIIADKSLNKKLKIEKRGDRLLLGMKPFSGFLRKSPIAIITMPELDQIDLSGACELVAAGFGSDNDFSCKLAGASTADIDIIAKDCLFDLSGASDLTAVLESDLVTIELSGSSDIALFGFSKSLTVDSSGASSGELQGFRTGDVTINLSGSSDFHINMNGTLNLDASGASTMYYTGNIALGDIELSGASTLKEE